VTEPDANPAYHVPEDGPQRAPGSRAARPRHAATLILVRRDAPEPRVLMGRRHGGHSFMPDKWVFPGGRVDRADYTAPAASELRPAVRANLEKIAPPALARALALAAIRETFEEAGLLLGRPGRAKSRSAAWSDFLKQGHLPDLDALDFIARAVTPPYRPKRFDARFFTADAERLTAMDRIQGSGELDEIAWVAIDDALGLDLPNITSFILKELRLRLADPTRPALSMSVRGLREL
jgi:8-oxo-dGTP pyrophosphatase MutT (NUDIX family)